MSTICLAAQRSFATGEAVYFSYRLPTIRKKVFQTLFWLMTLFAFVVAGLYAHIYWQCRHPAPPPKPVKVVNPDVHPSDMHYVYVSKPFPPPKPEPLPAAQALPPVQDDALWQADDDWRQAPDGELSAVALPGTENQTSSLQERFLQALQEQKADYQQGKVPPPPEDETLNDYDAMRKTRRIPQTPQNARGQPQPDDT
ncbi:hypothetical protein INP82_01810 [Citrobacter sedlakii]|uniref:hypothetical protein n=1 Tax=Citrobacter TaxID=544 RepID=UPI00196A0D16|nr:MULTISPECIES: hypothetical protein [Citrobacter]MBM9566160.1 hypothetical protein [Citrobacter sedlakii]HBL4690919.1 hypothetical protein [Citrobacter sedlakii]HBL4705829.1 hypothetical protein [Citrobacter sedlakii]HBL4720107.1 hypothetical protein [Citrobacter sedlakii]HCA7841058.1 hypothetical protein [Citrobacter sedlakii]